MPDPSTAKRTQLKAEITVKRELCPPEHAAAYWNAWRLLFEAAGIIPKMGESELGASNTSIADIEIAEVIG